MTTYGTRPGDGARLCDALMGWDDPWHVPPPKSDTFLAKLDHALKVRATQELRAQVEGPEMGWTFAASVPEDHGPRGGR